MGKNITREKCIDALRQLYYSEYYHPVKDKQECFDTLYELINLYFREPYIREEDVNSELHIVHVDGMKLLESLGYTKDKSDCIGFIGGKIKGKK